MRSTLLAHSCFLKNNGFPKSQQWIEYNDYDFNIDQKNSSLKVIRQVWHLSLFDRWIHGHHTVVGKMWPFSINYCDSYQNLRGLKLHNQQAPLERKKPLVWALKMFSHWWHDLFLGSVFSSMVVAVETSRVWLQPLFEGGFVADAPKSWETFLILPAETQKRTKTLTILD